MSKIVELGGCLIAISPSKIRFSKIVYMADDLSIKVSLHDVIKTTKASKEITLDLKKNYRTG